MSGRVALVFLGLSGCGTDESNVLDAAAVESGAADSSLPDSRVVFDSGCTYLVPVTAADKTCMSTSDCAIFFHAVNCTGTSAAIGANKSSRPELQDAEAVQEGLCRGRGCSPPPGPTLADDGTTAPSPSSLPTVTCVGTDGGLCITSYADGGPLEAGTD